MSHVQKTSSPSLENLLSNVLENTDVEDSRSRAVAVEAHQRYIEYLQEVIDTPVSFDTSVTIKVDGKTIRFKNEKAMADFLMELT